MKALPKKDDWRAWYTHIENKRFEYIKEAFGQSKTINLSNHSRGLLAEAIELIDRNIFNVKQLNVYRGRGSLFTASTEVEIEEYDLKFFSLVQSIVKKAKEHSNEKEDLLEQLQRVLKCYTDDTLLENLKNNVIKFGDSVITFLVMMERLPESRKEFELFLKNYQDQFKVFYNIEPEYLKQQYKNYDIEKTDIIEHHKRGRK